MWTVLLYVYVCAASAVLLCSAQVPWFVDSYEGSACKTPSGASGVCKERDDCLVRLPNPAPVSEDSNGRALCGSVGPSALVCCDVTKTQSDDVTKIPNDDVTSSTTTAPQIVTTTDEPPRAVGERSAKYCLSIIPFTKQPWWNDDGLKQDNNDVQPWWEEKEKKTVRSDGVFHVNGGTKTYHREFPHMALLGYLAPGREEISWHCAGSLINERFVLTARHCFTDRELRAPVVVRLGEYDLTSNDRTEQDFGIEKTWFHPREQPGTWYHDIALIRLNKEVKFNEAISPACLSSIPEDLERREGLVVTGWGGTAGDDRPSRVLLKGSAPLSVVSRNQCAAHYRLAKHLLPNGIHPGMMCAADSGRYVDTCQGDSGGPIQLSTSYDIYVIVGVTSSGVGRCGDGTPTIYTRVAYYLGWIESIVWPHGVE